MNTLELLFHQNYSDLLVTGDDNNSVLVYRLNNSLWKCHTSSPVINAVMANAVGRPIATIALRDILFFRNLFVSDAGRNCAAWSKPLSYREM